MCFTTSFTISMLCSLSLSLSLDGKEEKRAFEKPAKERKEKEQQTMSAVQNRYH